MLFVWDYVVSMLAFFWLVGIAGYFLDRKLGVHLYRWMYNLFHKQPMPPDIERGFLYKQPTNRKVAVAVLIDTIQSVYVLAFKPDVNYLAEVVLWLLEPITMLFGFWMGAGIYRFLTRRRKIFQKIDDLGAQLRSGEIKENIRGAGAKVVDAISAIPGQMGEAVYPSSPAPPVPPTTPLNKPKEPEPPAPEVFDGKEAIDRYTRRK